MRTNPASRRRSRTGARRDYLASQSDTRVAGQRSSTDVGNASVRLGAHRVPARERGEAMHGNARFCTVWPFDKLRAGRRRRGLQRLARPRPLPKTSRFGRMSRSMRVRSDELTILWSDANLVAVAKPAGLATIPGRDESDSVL